MKKICVFDLDGTLVDSIHDIADTINRNLEKLGKKTYPVDEYYQMVGEGMASLCHRALPDGTEEEIENFFKVYREDYLHNCCVKTYPYDGIPDLLRTLQESGMRLVIITNKPQEHTDVIVEKLLGKENFSYVIGTGGPFPRKPDTASMEFIMETFDVKPEEIWHIGDSDIDMIFGKNAGVDTIGVTWGFRGEQELRSSGATAIVNDVPALADYIAKNRS